jgi:DNA-binding beta-propeller fold protein YncE
MNSTSGALIQSLTILSHSIDHAVNKILQASSGSAGFTCGFREITFKPLRENTSEIKTMRKIAWLAICWIFFLPVKVSPNEIRHVRVEHVMDIHREFNQPTEVAVENNGRIFILDGANNQVKIFNPKWEFVLAIGRAGEANGEFRNPVGMDFDEQGHVYVADTGNQRIQIFNGTGKYLRKIDLTRWKARPVEVKVLKSTNRIYVSDAKNHQILCFNSDGSFNFSWGSSGEQLGELRFPGIMAVDQSGDIYVADILNGRVQTFNPMGKDSRQIGELGVLPGQLFRPKGIAIDNRSRIYVSDSYTGIIQVFEKTGKLLGILSGQEDTFLRLTTPIGMAFDSKGRLYVVQSTLNKVSVFKFRDKGTW